MLLWRESIAIEERSEKERLAEMYVAVRDAVSRVASLVLSKSAPRDPKLWYLVPEAGETPLGLVPGEGLEEAVDRLDARLRGRNVGSRVH